MRYLFLLLLLTCKIPAFSQTEYTAPVAKKVPKIDTVHGKVLIDNYSWLREKNNPEVINHLYAENAYADNMMRDTRILQKKLFEEMRARIQENYEDLPVKRDSFYYYYRFEKDKNYPIHCRKKDSLSAPEEIYLDQNELAKEFMYFQLSLLAESPDHNFVMYGVDNKGDNVMKLFIKDLRTDSIYYDEVPNVTDAVWANDNRNIYYLIPEEKTKRSYRLFRHMLGTDKSKDELLYEEKDVTFIMSLSRSPSKKYIFLSLFKTKASEHYFVEADDSKGKLTIVEPREHEHLYTVNHFGGNEFFIRTNWNALNFRVMSASVKSPARKNWKELIPHQPNVLNLGGEQYKDYMVIGEKEDALTRVRIISNDRKEDYYIDFPAKLATSSWSRAYEFEDNKIRVSYESMIQPGIIFDYDLLTKQRTELWMDTVMSGYNQNDYITEKIYATAVDGKKVPVTIAYKKGLTKNGNNPTFLTSYGSYGSGSEAAFSKSRLSYLNRGFVVAIAHIRGGDDLGRQWYEEGKLLKKKNTFTDFIAAAEHLIKEGYTNSNKLAITGGSAGGLLMGAVTNMRPNLFKAVVALVPFVDVINTMLDETIPLTTFEYEEWGDPRNPEFFNYMYSYSPYDNIERKDYPAIFARAGYNDAQVGYWEPAKWVAKLREMKTDTNLLIFKTVMEGGHGGVSGRYESLKQAAFEMAFVMKVLGIKENYIDVAGKVTDVNGNAIPYVNIVVSGTSKGTTTNDEGEFQLTLREDEPQQLVFQSIGYKRHTENINMNTRTRELHVKLESENLQLQQVTISASAKDPAYAIIKNAINKRKDNLERVNSLSTDIYIKSTVRLNKVPDKLPKFISKAELPDSNDLGLMYLSESVAKYHFMQPDHEKEEMLSSKVGGMGKGFSWNRASDVRFNFYENTVPISYYSDRPFISPISSTALIYYKYKFQGSFYEDGKVVNKIEVIPRRKGDPLFKGHIFIVEDNWQIHSLNLYLTKDAQIEWVDTLFISEEYVPVQDSVWMPLSMKMTSYIKVFGFDATDMTVGFFSNYNLNRSFPAKFFKNEVFKVEENANKKDTSYWQETRPFVLSTEESKYYKKADSLEAIKNSPAYKDSVARKRNKVTLGKILIGGYSYHYNEGEFNKRISVSSLLSNVSFNTVEGPVTEIRTSYSMFSEETYKYKLFVPQVRYGFSNKHLNAMLRYSERYNPKKLAIFTVRGGSYVFHYNEEQPISNLINTGYTLLAEQNFAKLYEKRFLKFENKVELVNGLINNSSIEYSHRMPLTNTSDLKLVDIKEREYTSNNPFSVGDGPAFNTHDALIVGIDFTYRHKQKYESYPNRKIILGSKYPELYVNYKTGLGFNGAKFNYHYVFGGAGDNIDLKTFGVFKFDVGVGTFLNRKEMTFIDYKHFTGNRTLFLTDINEYDWYNQGRTRLSSFHTLDYYSHSTNRTFVEVHAQQHFKGFFLSKFPLIRKLKWQEIAGINGAYTADRHYTELFVGVDNIFKVLRVDFATSYDKSRKIRPEFRIGLKTEL